MTKKPKRSTRHDDEEPHWDEPNEPHPEPEYQDPPQVEPAEPVKQPPPPLGTLYISEYVEAPVIGGRSAPVVLEPAIAEQVVRITAESTQSAQFHASTRLVRLHSDGPCSIRFGVDPVATNSSGRLHGTEYRGVSGGLKVAVIVNS